MPFAPWADCCLDFLLLFFILNFFYAFDLMNEFSQLLAFITSSSLSPPPSSSLSTSFPGSAALVRFWAQ
jgi:hypothetical protein